MSFKSKTHLATKSLLSLMMLGGAAMYVFNNPMVAETFTALGFPTYIIYPLALAKVLGVVAIWQKHNKTLRDLAYAGFFYDFILAAAAHIMISDGEFGAALVAWVLVVVSFSTKNTTADAAQQDAAESELPLAAPVMG